MSKKPKCWGNSNKDHPDIASCEKCREYEKARNIERDRMEKNKAKPRQVNASGNQNRGKESK